MRILRLVALLAVAGCAAEPGPGYSTSESGKSPPNSTQRFADPDADRKKLAEIFLVLELPDVRDLKLVAHCLPGSGSRPAPVWPPVEPVVLGWLVDSSPTEVRLLTVDGEIKVFGGGPPDGDGASAWLASERRVDSVRGSWTDADFEYACNRGLFETDPGYGFAWHGVRYALLAHWSFQRGNEKLARDRLRACQAWAAAQSEHGRANEDWTVALCHAIFDQASFDANAAAVRGAPRGDLRAFWERLTPLPCAEVQRKVRTLVAAYGSLIEEDAGFEELSGDQLAALTAQERVRYWFHKLRDLTSDPFGDAFYLGSLHTPGNAAHELAALGEEAKAFLTAHAEDGRPTRCALRGHRTSLEWRLMTHGEMCRDILQVIEFRQSRAK